jgi:hypothetical protein
MIGAGPPGAPWTRVCPWLVVGVDGVLAGGLVWVVLEGFVGVPPPDPVDVCGVRGRTVGVVRTG